MMLPEQFCRLMSESLDEEVTEKFVEAMAEPSSAFIRLNPFKQAVPPPAFLSDAQPVPWCKWGYRLAQRPVFTLHPLFHCGAYYVQDSSSMFVGELLRKALSSIEAPGRPLRVLDLCAAPGGKSTDALASLRERFADDFILVSNELIRNRCQILSDNLALWGDPNVVITSVDPAAFAALGPFFDIIIADVPCSGEGMFRKDATALAEWSEDAVKMCQTRQRKILESVWDSLLPGGLLLYSTCTFNHFENDDNAAWVMESLGAENITPELAYDAVIRTGYGYSLVPGLVPGEGQYCTLLQKFSVGAASTNLSNQFSPRSSSLLHSKQKPSVKLPPEAFTVEMCQELVGDSLRAFPAALETQLRAIESVMKIVRAGVTVGKVKGTQLVPSADLALSSALSEDFWQNVNVDRDTALAFLHRDVIVLGPEVPKSFVTLSFKGLKLGFVKNLGNRCNNLHPMARRILMDIPK